MKTDLQSVKDKLVKLINLSENHAASQGEIDNALNAAAQIMARHNLTRDDIDLDSSNPTKNVRMSRSYVTCLNSNSTTWEGNLARFCVEFVGNIGYYKSCGIYGLNKTKKLTVYYFYGSIDEVEIAVELFQEIQSAVSIMAVTRFDNFYSKQGGSYCEGFIQGLEQSYHTEKLKLRGDSMTNALIIKSDKTSLMIKEASKDWLATVHKIRLRQGQGTKGAKGGADARSLGKRDGSNYSIGKRSNTRKIN